MLPRIWTTLALGLSVSALPSLAFDAQKEANLVRDGSAAFQAKDYAKAESLYSQALNLFGADQSHELDKATVLTNLAAAEGEERKCTEADAHFKEAIQIKQKLLGARSPSTVNTLKHYEHMLRRCGRADAADQLQRIIASSTAPPISSSNKVGHDQSEDDTDVGETTEHQKPIVKAVITILHKLDDDDRRTMNSPRYGTREVLDHYERVLIGYDHDAFGNDIPRYQQRPVYRTEQYEIWNEFSLKYYRELIELAKNKNLQDEFKAMCAVVEDDGGILELDNGWIASVEDLPSTWHSTEPVIVVPHPHLPIPHVVIIDEAYHKLAAAVLLADE